jgi:hypothetical protein
MADGTKIVKEVSAVITASDESNPGITRFEQRLDAMKDHAASAGHKAGESFIHSLNDQIGRKSELAHFAHILEGAGAVGGVTILAHVLKEAADHANELVTKFREGQISARDMAADLAHSIPVVGQLATAFEAVGKLARNAVGLPSESDLADEDLRKKEEHRKDVDEFQKKAREQAERRQKVIDKVNQDYDSEAKASQLRGLKGPDLENARAAQEYEEKLRKYQGLEGELSQLSPDQAEQQAKRIAELRLSAYKDYVADTGRIDDEAAAERVKKAAEEAEKKKQAEEKVHEKARATQEHQAATAEQLQQFRIDELRITGQLSEKDEKRLHTAEEFQRKRAELMKILNDENASDAQKKQARSFLAALPGDLQSALAADNITAPAKTKAAATGQVAGRTSGVAGLAQASADHDRERDRNLKSIADNSKKANDLLGQLITQIGEMNAVFPM